MSNPRTRPSLLRRAPVACCLLAILTIGNTVLAAQDTRALEGTIRTSCLRLAVSSSSEVAADSAGAQFSYFADLPGAPGYLRDGYLILGTSAEDLTYSTIDGPYPGTPTVDNPFGYLNGDAAGMVFDSTSSSNVRTAAGTGYNRDSTLQFSITWYAAKHPDSCSFLVGHFRIYKGPNGATVNSLTLAYFADWDIPADVAAENYGGGDASRYMVYQRGSLTGGSNASRYGAIGGMVESADVVGGFVVPNGVYIDPLGNWENDSLWIRLSNLAQNQYDPGPYPDPLAGSGPAADLSSVMVFRRGATIAVGDTIDMAVVLAGQHAAGGTLSQLRSVLYAGYRFACDRNLVPASYVCPSCKCGDADNNGIWTISDGVYLMTWLYGGGPAPAVWCLGESDGFDLITNNDILKQMNFDTPYACTSQPKLVGQTTSQLKILYSDFFPANQSSATIDIRLQHSLPQGLYSFDLPLRVRVDGQDPLSLSASAATSNWPQGAAFVGSNSTTWTAWCSRIHSLSVPAGNYLLMRITIGMPSSPYKRKITLEPGGFGPYMTGVFEGPNSPCHYLLFLSGICQAWTPEFVPLSSTFVCGDADGSEIISISDAVFLIAYIFNGGPAPNPLDAGDVDCNSVVNISDAVALISYIFAGGPAPCEACDFGG